VLSACETGVAEPLGGEELAGISQAFMPAGARSMLVSLWEVDDEATRAFMSAFYAAYNKGMDKASAARSAMIATRQQAGADPYHWGAFALIGDWEHREGMRYGIVLGDAVARIGPREDRLSLTGLLTAAALRRLRESDRRRRRRR
jgi:hypothetical protein